MNAERTPEQQPTDPMDIRFGYHTLYPHVQDIIRRNERRGLEPGVSKWSEPYTIFTSPDARFKPVRMKDMGGRHPSERKAIGATYAYSDQLQHIGNYAEAQEQARDEIGNNDSPRYFEAMLRNLYGKEDLELQQIHVGINMGTEYAYHIYGFIVPSELSESYYDQLAEADKLELEFKESRTLCDSCPRRNAASRFVRNAVFGSINMGCETGPVETGPVNMLAYNICGRDTARKTGEQPEQSDTAEEPGTLRQILSGLTQAVDFRRIRH